MLAWAATIHKVQGMEFDCLHVDFFQDTMGNSGRNEFYHGLAHMVLSRAETVIVVGRLTLALLLPSDKPIILRRRPYVFYAAGLPWLAWDHGRCVPAWNSSLLPEDQRLDLGAESVDDGHVDQHGVKAAKKSRKVKPLVDHATLGAMVDMQVIVRGRSEDEHILQRVNCRNSGNRACT